MPSNQLRLNEQQLIYLADKAKNNAARSGNLSVKLSDGSTTKWNVRYFVLHMNFLFEFQNQDSTKPTNVYLLEQCDFERTAMKNIHDYEHQFSFCIVVPGVTSCLRVTLKAENENDCTVWYQKITQSSYALLQTKKDDFEHKYCHVLQILESERAGAWQLLQQCQEQAQQLKDLRLEVAGFRKRESQGSIAVKEAVDNESEEIAKVKKVQSLFRGLLCRRRWHNIVQDYIRSPHAQSMRKRNQIVFELVRSEEEYLQTLSTLVTSFFRPLKMAASSKKPPLSHEEVNSIFLNSETLMFLHQIFFNGLQTRMESWPTLVLGDLFDMLLPMLSIYQEYVRNHHYSLQILLKLQQQGYLRRRPPNHTAVFKIHFYEVLIEPFPFIEWQTLADCKQRDAFRRVLKMHEERPNCCGRTLESFLTIPMYRIPNYIVSLNQLVSLTPPDHVERKSLEHAQSVLEELSTVMQDEVSETENIRRNLSIERQFAEGCEELLDVEQIFIRQGPLLQVGGSECQNNRRRSFSTLTLKSHDRKDSVRQCFLFSRCLLVTSRTSNGKLQIVPNGKFEFQHTTLVEDVVDEDIDFLSLPSASDGGNLVFKLIVNHPDEIHSLKILFLAASVEDKASWASDISQCIENLKSPECEDSVSITSRQSLLSIRSDARLFTNDQDIKYSKALDSSRLPRIQYGSIDRLLERLMDVRFLSVEFLNTYLTTYRIFSDAVVLFDSLLQWYYSKAQFEYPNATVDQFDRTVKTMEFKPKVVSHRNSCPSAVTSNSMHEMKNRRLRTQRHSAVPFSRDIKSPTTLYPPTILSNRRHSSPSALFEEPAFSFPTKAAFMSPQENRNRALRKEGARERSISGPTSCGLLSKKAPDCPISESNPISKCRGRTSKSIGEPALDYETDSFNQNDMPNTSAFTRVQEADAEKVPVLKLDSPPKMKKRDSKRKGSSAEVVVSDIYEQSESKLTVIESTSIDMQYRDSENIISTVGVTVTPATSPISSSPPEGFKGFWREFSCESASSRDSNSSSVRPDVIGTPSRTGHTCEQSITIKRKPGGRYETVFDAVLSPSPPTVSPRTSPRTSPLTPPRTPGSKSPQTPRSPITRFKPGRTDIRDRKSCDLGRTSPLEALRSPTFSRSPNSSPPSPAPGVVVTSHRSSRRRSSISSAAVAFAAATAGASVSPAASPTSASRFRFGFNFQFAETIEGHVVTMRVLKILKHWISKQIEDFKTSDELRQKATDFLTTVFDNEDSSQTECKAANALLKTLQADECEERRLAHNLIFQPTVSDRTKSTSPIVEKYSSIQLAEQLTYVHQTLLSIIPAREFLDTAWMKDEKDVLAPNILRVINNFNLTSRLIASDILSKQSASLRSSTIEKWAAVADVCRCMHNFNGLLAVITAFTSSAVYRLKKTWEKVSKQTRILLEKLQSIISAEGRFRNMREALRSCDPPCVPYLGYYLTDLAFIEEGTPNFNDVGLVNFSKMRMIANVIQEIRTYQQTPYKIKPIEKIITYLVANDSVHSDEELYRLSLQLEPRRRGSSSRSQRPGVTFI